MSQPGMSHGLPGGRNGAVGDPDGVGVAFCVGIDTCRGFAVAVLSATGCTLPADDASTTSASVTADSATAPVAASTPRRGPSPQPRPSRMRGE